jgi:hypothetical protein
MKRHNRNVIVALATIVIAGAALPLKPAVAQSGDAVAQAEQACIGSGLTPRSTAFETCVSRSAFDFDRGQPEMAAHDAVMVRDADDVCQSYGISPTTLGYRQCVGSQIEKSTISSYNIRYDVPSYDITHGVAVDSGFVIRAVP